MMPAMMSGSSARLPVVDVANAVAVADAVCAPAVKAVMAKPSAKKARGKHLKTNRENVSTAKSL
jgi:hypothetical protein